jgi:hypothetical protein
MCDDKPLLAFGSALKFVSFQQQTSQSHGLATWYIARTKPISSNQPENRCGKEDFSPRAYLRISLDSQQFSASSTSPTPALQQNEGSTLHFPAKGQPQYIACRSVNSSSDLAGRPYTASRPLPWTTPTELPNKWHLDTRRRPECNI